MLALLIVLAGIALVVGGNVAKDFAGKLLKGVLGVCLVLAVLPCLVQSCGCLLRNASPTETSAPAGLLAFLLLVTFVAIGAAVWKLRSFRSRFRDLSVRRHGAPRTRALPPPPPPSVGGQS
jgi:hypothetical protein